LENDRCLQGPTPTQTCQCAVNDYNVMHLSQRQNVQTAAAWPECPATVRGTERNLSCGTDASLYRTRRLSNVQVKDSALNPPGAFDLDVDAIVAGRREAVG